MVIRRSGIVLAGNKGIESGLLLGAAAQDQDQPIHGHFGADAATVVLCDCHWGRIASQRHQLTLVDLLDDQWFWRTVLRKRCVLRTGQSCGETHQGKATKSKPIQGRHFPDRGPFSGYSPEEALGGRARPGRTPKQTTPAGRNGGFTDGSNCTLIPARSNTTNSRLQGYFSGTS
jgi:hypothetical protein